MAIAHPIHHAPPFMRVRPGTGWWVQWRDRLYGRSLFTFMAFLEHPFMLRLERFLGGNGRSITQAENAR